MHGEPTGPELLAEPFEPGSQWVPLRAGWISATGGPARPLTAEELQKTTRGGVLAEQMETILTRLA